MRRFFNFLYRAAFPMLFSAYPLLFLYAYNTDYVRLNDLTVPLLVVLGGTVVLLGLFYVLLRDIVKAGIMTSAFALLFLSFGRMFSPLCIFFKWRCIDITEIQFLIFLCVILVLLFVLLYFSKKDFSKMAGVLNGVAFALVAVNVYTIVCREIEKGPVGNLMVDDEYIRTEMKTLKGLPNIYFLLEDNYARADTFKSVYGYDNSQIVQTLRKKGFFVADECRPNYITTGASLSSMLNMRYVNVLTERYGKFYTSTIPFEEAIIHNRLFPLLRDMGYQIVVCPSDITWTENFEVCDSMLGEKYSSSDYVMLLINLSPIPVFYAKPEDSEEKDLSLTYSAHYEKMMDNLDHFADLSHWSDETPKFVFWHSMVTHSPFLFDKDGSYREREGTFTFADFGTADRQASEYLDTVTYFNSRLPRIVDKIIRESNRPSIIIVVSDHGPSLAAKSIRDRVVSRTANFIAVYVPDQRTDLFYDRITPVNVVRTVMREYLGMDTPNLEDRTYIIPQNTGKNYYYYYFLDVTDKLNDGIDPSLGAIGLPDDE